MDEKAEAENSVLDPKDFNWKDTLKKVERQDLSFATHSYFIEQSLRILKLRDVIYKKETPLDKQEEIVPYKMDGIQEGLISLINKNKRIADIDKFIREKAELLYNEAEDLKYYWKNWREDFPKLKILKGLLCMLKLGNGDTYNFYGFKKVGSKLVSYKSGTKFDDAVITTLELLAYTDTDIHTLLNGDRQGYLNEENFAKYSLGLWQRVKRKKEADETYGYTLSYLNRTQKVNWIKENQIYLIHTCHEIVYEPKNKAMIFLRDKKYYFNLYKESKLMGIENDKGENIPYHFTETDFPILYPYLNHLVSGDDKCLNYLLAWLAQIIAGPGVRTKILLVLYGPNRTGKTTLYNNLLKVIFESNASSSYSLSGDMLRNNVDLMHSSFIFIEDIDNYGSQGEQTLKRVIDEGEHSLRYLYNEVFEIPNFHNFMLTTNNIESVKVGKKGRIFPLEVTKSTEIKHLVDNKMVVPHLEDTFTKKYLAELRRFVLFLKYHFGILKEKHGNVVTWLNNNIPTTTIIEEIQFNQYDDIQSSMEDIGRRRMTIKELLVETKLIAEDSSTTDSKGHLQDKYNEETDYAKDNILIKLQEQALINLKGDYMAEISEIRAENERGAILTTGVYVLFSLWGCKYSKIHLSKRVKRVIIETLTLKFKPHLDAVITNYFRANKRGFNQELFYRTCLVLSGAEDIEENYFWKQPSVNEYDNSKKVKKIPTEAEEVDAEEIDFEDDMI